MTKQERLSNGKKTVFLTNGAGRTGQKHAEECSYIIHKIKLKMDTEPECETGNHQNPRGESRQQSFLPQPQQFLAQHISKVKGIKSKNELLGPHQNKKLLRSEGNNQQN